MYTSQITTTSFEIP